MFESLDPKALDALANIEEQAALKSQATLSEITKCLDQAIRECQDRAQSGTANHADFRQAADGMMAAQRIVNKCWAEEGASA